MELPNLGYGCSAYWSNASFPIEQSIELVHTAFEHGIRYFDTGSSYGDAEQRLGIALRDIPRSSVFVSTKAGTLQSLKKSFSEKNLIQSVNNSLENLECEYLDILYLHGPEIDNLQTAKSAARQLLESGLVRNIGVNSFDSNVLRAALKYPDYSHLMFEHNPVNQNQDLLDEAIKNNKTVVTGTGVGQNLGSPSTLFPKSRKHLWYFLRALAKHPDNLARSYFNKFPKNLDNLSRPQLFLLYQLLNNSISSTVFGTTNINHLKENAAVLKHDLSSEARNILLKYQRSNKSMNRH